ncbi:MAG: ATP-binding cassette domain-containing protein, partial [Thermodesulfobacteriota bacterium]|nr:ATP-binding cassette domain-containing protein [Thermodesulfobacteriota bacterium]
MIQLINLYKTFNNIPVLNGLNLAIEGGKITVIIGQSGCGKTVILKHIIGLMRPDSGSIMVDGVDITKLREKELFRVRKKFGMLFQEGALFDSMTIAE